MVTNYPKCMCVCVYAHAHVYTYKVVRGQVWVSSLISAPPPYFLRQGLSLNINLDDSSRLDDQTTSRDLPVLAIPAMELQTHATVPSVVCGY